METHTNINAWNDIGEEDRSYLKMKVDMEKNGYREGIEEGRNKVFQTYFDKGYLDGFKNGFILGKIKGENRAKEILNIQDFIKAEEIEKSSTGVCILCKDAKNTSLSISEIKSNQINYLETSIDKLSQNSNNEPL